MAQEWSPVETFFWNSPVFGYFSFGNILHVWIWICNYPKTGSIVRAMTTTVCGTWANIETLLHGTRSLFQSLGAIWVSEFVIQSAMQKSTVHTFFSVGKMRTKCGLFVALVTIERRFKDD